MPSRFGCCTRPPKVWGNAEVIDDAAVFARYGVHAHEVRRICPTGAAMASDGLPGVKGIGEKTAANPIRTYSTLANVIAAAEDSSSDLARVRKNLLAGGTTSKLPVRLSMWRVIIGTATGWRDSLPNPHRLDELRALSGEWGLTKRLIVGDGS